MRCPSCNHDNSVDASFCDACGAKLESICATLDIATGPASLESPRTQGRSIRLGGRNQSIPAMAELAR